MSNYLKKILFSLLIIVVPYMNSASNAMNEEDYDGSTVRTRKISFVEEDRQDFLSFAKPSTTSKAVNLEDSKVSWISYLSSPVKSVFQGANEIMDFAIKRPKLAMVIGLYYIIPAVAASCGCYCRPQGGDGTQKTYEGNTGSQVNCWHRCVSRGLVYFLCVENTRDL